MKLNKNGWGTMEMLLLCAGLLIALLIAVFFISKLYGSLEASTSNREYMNLELKLEESAKEYVKENDVIITTNYKITLKTLKDSNKIDNFKDSFGNECDGYVLINNIDNNNYYNGYIKCNNYETRNY